MSKTLLLADDSETIRRVIELTFADEDIEVVAVGDGQQAIDRIKAHPPDIVLADTGMPERDGYEVAAFVKGDPVLAGIPVVLLTGAFEPLDEHRAQQVGANGVLVKPFEPQLVIKRVRELLEGYESLAAAAAAAGALGDVARLASSTAGPPQSEQASEMSAESLRPASPRPSGAAGYNSLGAEDLDSYFDQLDAAFADLDTAGKKARRQLQPPWRDSVVDADGAENGSSDPRPLAGPSVKPEHDFGGWDVTLPGAQPEPPAAPSARAREEDAAIESGEPWIREAEAPAASPAPAAAGLPPVVPEPAEAAPLANAFAALLAAEQGVPGARSAPGAWPAALTPAITDELVDDLAQRVLERLTDRAIREAVAEAVGGVAERLVREEIERIKADAK